MKRRSATANTEEQLSKELGEQSLLSISET